MVLIDTLATGGAERVAVDLACGVDRRRFAPHVVVTRETGPLQQQLDAADIPVTVLGRRRRLSLVAYRRARRAAQGCDLIHAHKFSSNVWGALLARMSRRPLIVHEHNWSGTPSRLRSFLNRRWIAPVTSHFVCVSAPVAHQVVGDGVPAHKVHVLPNAIPPGRPMARRAARQELGLPATAFVVGIVARLRPEKNHELLLRAAARLVTAHQAVTICAVGDGPRRAFLETLAEDLGIADHLVWAGERRDAGRLAAAFDISVLCSTWEGLPLVALEAMAAGVPVIATAVGGLPELLADGAGVLVPPGDADCLVSAIATLRATPDLAARIGAAGRRRVRDQHDLPSTVARLDSMYAEATEAQVVIR
ncbi:glycosyltransferase [Actinopolymorpha rutila]|uniref:glycosyltransferase n=1 Tax=Actinopolymorpha rutila TaxID=446787 RepID=UPI001EE35541|nr:glycosyltransferase [Actinopolymorpha rutila]